MKKFVNIFLRRLKNRVKHLFNFKEMWNWEYESCEECGSCFRVAYQINDEKWNAVYGSSGGCLCLSCFLRKATKKDIYLTEGDFSWLSLFNPDKGVFYNLIDRRDK